MPPCSDSGGNHLNYVSGTGITCGSTTAPITSAVVNATYNLTTASGSQTVTDFGFTPSSCDGFGSVNGSSGHYATLAAHSDSGLNQTNLSYTNVSGGLYTAPVSNTFFFPSDAAGTDYQTGVISAYGSGSVTITWTKTGTPTGTFTFSLRCIK
jgi:hypothetical protein